MDGTGPWEKDWRGVSGLARLSARPAWGGANPVARSLA
jgi:hypothetical protein